MEGEAHDTVADPSADQTARAARALEIRWVLLTVAVALLATVWVLELWRADLRAPLMYDGDGLTMAATIKGTIDSGWFLDNASLGAPGGLDLRDYPIPDVLHEAALKVIGMVTGGWVAALNVYYLLGYVLAALFAHVSLRKLGLSPPAALVAAVLYAFLPYHMLRGGTIGQLFLASYFLVPLAALVVARSMERPLLFGRAPGGRWRVDLRQRASWGAVLVCALTALAGVYYAFFMGLLLIVGGGYAAITRRSRVYALSAAALCLVLAAVALCAVWPSIGARMAQGPNPTAVSRAAIEADIFGVKIDQMLLPVDGHRIAPFARLKNSYVLALRGWAPWMPAVASFMSLGVLGSLGLCVLLGVLVSPSAHRSHHGDPGAATVWRLAVLNAAALGIALAGGIGYFIAKAFPLIRAYDRMIVFVAFFSLAAVGLLADRLVRRYAVVVPRGATVAVALALVVIGLFDQSSPALLADYGSNARRFRSDHAFVEAVEKALPAGAMVWQLPYMPFPEAPQPYPGTMNDYDHLRPYLHSSGLRWSYAAMKGRSTDLWQREVAGLSPAAMVAAVKAKGFRAVVVALDGYADRGSALMSELRAAGAGAPIVSPDGKFAFMDLEP